MTFFPGGAPFSSVSIKKTECQRTDDFQLQCWRRLLSPLDCKEIKPVNPKGNQSWIFIGRIDAEAEAPILWSPDAKNWHWKRLWCWEGLKAGGEGDDRGWDGWMSSLTWWTWVWANSWSWWWTGSPGMLQSMGSQRVGHDWATELNWTELNQCRKLKDSNFIPGLGRCLGEGHGNPLEYSCLENPMDREAWQAMVHRVAESDMT